MLDRLEREGKIRVIEEERNPWPYDSRHIIQSKFVRTCQRCGAEYTYTNVEYLIKSLTKTDCGKCWRDNPERKSCKKKYIEYPRQTDIPLDFPVRAENGVADIYCRVSTRKQSNGGGLSRQEEYAIKYCELNQIRVRHIIQDVCSAYIKDNCVTGNLGYKIGEWEEGKESPPQRLVLEDMDRFSRQHPWKVLGHIQRLKDLGIRIVVTGVCNTNQEPEMIL